MKLSEMRVYLRKVGLLLLIIVTTLSGKPLISSRKRLRASGKMKIGSIDSSHLYGETQKELHFKKSQLHFSNHLSVFGVWPCEWLRFLHYSLLLYEKAARVAMSHNKLKYKKCIHKSI